MRNAPRLAASLAVLIVAFSVHAALRRGRTPRIQADLVESVLKASAAASRAWPGYEPLGQPLLVAFKGEGSLLIGTTAYPAGFERAAWADASVSVSGRSFAPKFSYVKKFDLDGSTVTAMSIEDRPDVYDWTAYFVHERFHNAQNVRFKNRSWRNYPVEDPRDVALAALEGRRLADWVERGDPEGVRDFDAIRSRRRRLFPDGYVEKWEEHNEGTAEFVETAANETAWPRANIRRLLADRLRKTIKPSDMAKWRHYSIGAALCLWLDAEKDPDWRGAVEDGFTPSDIVHARLRLPPEEAERRVEALTRTAEYDEALAAARRGLESLRAERSRRLDEYFALPGRRLVLAGDAARASHSGPWLDFPDGSSLMSAKLWSDDFPGYHIRLRDMFVRETENTAEFVLPPETVVLIDGKRWAPTKDTHTIFRSLSISAPPRIELTAGPGDLGVYFSGRMLFLRLEDPRR
jgi:hypothetical protein